MTRNLDHILAQRLYKRFDRSITLTKITRQQGAEQAAFRTALSHLRRNRVTVDDWKLFASRIQAKLRTTNEDLSRFDLAIRIYPKKEQVRLYNHEKMRDIGNPVVIIAASYTGPQAETVKTEDAGNLQALLPISINCRIMLTENIWTERRLVNGALEIVRDIAWPAGTEDPRKQSPSAILVHFDNYDGPAVVEIEGEKLVPILPSVVSGQREMSCAAALNFLLL